MNKRKFLKRFVEGSASLVFAPTILSSCNKPAKNVETGEAVAADPAGIWHFDISLAQWSLHRALRAGELENLDFAAFTKREFGIEAVEYVNQFFKDKVKDQSYLSEMRSRATDSGVKSLLIMIDGEGHLGALDDAERTEAVENHYPWVEAAKFLGCHSIRVNAAGNGTAQEVSAAAVDGLGRLSTFAKDFGLNVIVENHGGYSSDGKWLSGVMAQVAQDNCGTLPDFGNFCIARNDKRECTNEYDRYTGVKELMTHAKAVSAKSHDFDAQGNEIHTDYLKMLRIVKEASYSGYVGIEYEGRELGEIEGIKATKALLEKVRGELKGA